MSKKKLISLIVCAALAIIVVIVLINKPNKDKYNTELVDQKTIIQTVEATGTVNPVRTVSIGSQISGIIKEIYVDYNSHVKKGQILALIDPSLVQAQVNQAQATLSSKKATYQKTKSVLEYNSVKYNRYLTLYKKNYISKNDLDQAKSDYLSKKAEVASTAADIKQAQATLQSNMTNLRYTRIISPVDGVVISKVVDVGQTVAASFQTPTLFTVAQDLGDMQIETSVSEADIGKVKVGQDVQYTLDGYPDKIFKGKVSQVRLASTTTNNVVTYTVVVRVDNSEKVLLPGMTANVQIITNKKDNVLVVPNMALKFTPDIKGPKYEKQGIWIFDKGKLKRIDVEVGASDDADTEVSAANLKKGTIVVVGSKDKKEKRRDMPHPPM